MLKELSRHASRDICHNQLEFSDYHLVYYVYAKNLAIIYPANNSYSTLCTCIFVPKHLIFLLIELTNNQILVN